MSSSCSGSTLTSDGLGYKSDTNTKQAYTVPLSDSQRWDKDLVMFAFRVLQVAVNNTMASSLIFLRAR